MKTRFALLGILAVISMVVTLVALSMDGISQAASDSDKEQIKTDTFTVQTPIE